MEARGRARNLDRFEQPGPVYTGTEYGPWLGSLLVSALAYPEAREATKRHEMAKRLRARNLADGLPTGPPWLNLEGPHGPISIPVDVARLSRGFTQLENRLRKRLVFASIALQPVLAAEGLGQPPARWGKAWNRAQAIRESNKEDPSLDVRNFERIYWRSSLAVAHVACAFAKVSLESQHEGTPFDVWSVIEDPAWSAIVVREAQRLEPIVVAGDLKVPPSILIKFRV
jgi:hypothetical protein